MDESISSSRWKREGRHHSHFWIRYLLAAYFFVVKGKFRRLVCSVAFIFLLDLNSDSLQHSSLRFFFCLHPPWIDYCYCSFSTAWTRVCFLFLQADKCRHHPRFQIRLLRRRFIFRITHRWLLSFVSAVPSTSDSWLQPSLLLLRFYWPLFVSFMHHELRGHGKGRLIFSPRFSHHVTFYAVVDCLFSEAIENGTGKTSRLV